MTVKKRLTIFLMFLVLLTGCKGTSSDVSSDTAVPNDKEYNLMITNNSPLFLKSVVVTVEEKNNNQINSLIDSNINLGEAAKFSINNGKHAFKITLNPKKNYSVSKEFREEFEKDKVVEYQVKIEENEVIIKKKDS
ncbi:hypothetical protein [Paenibacillus sp. GCM10012306]|uniref:hypothetical protein n=1 Tax=Paenibacillus sp. GCM10012306 TaxID=3317342 RepID=UPI00360D6CA5